MELQHILIHLYGFGMILKHSLDIGHVQHDVDLAFVEFVDLRFGVINTRILYILSRALECQLVLFIGIFVPFVLEVCFSKI